MGIAETSENLKQRNVHSSTCNTLDGALINLDHTNVSFSII